METGTKNKRQLQTAQTKISLFNAAESLLSEKDFSQITIRDIVSRANVSIGTFYNYYTTKMEVFYETYQVADRYFDEVVSHQLPQGSPLAQILCFFDHYARYSSEMTDMKMTRLLYNPDNPYFNRPAQGGMVGLLMDLIQECLDAGELVSRGDSVEDMASYLMISIRGLVYHWCTLNGSYDLRARTQVFTQRLLGAYLPGGAGAAPTPE